MPNECVQRFAFDATFAAMGAHGLRIHNPAGPTDAAAMAMARMMGWTRQFECKDDEIVSKISELPAVKAWLERRT